MSISEADPRPGTVPSRIVVRGTNWVGDTVMSLPAARELRRIFPDASITFWIPTHLADLVRASGVTNQILSFDGNVGGPLRRPFRMMGRLGQGRFDMAVLLQNAFESAFTAWLARIPLRAGYPTDLRGPLLNIRVPIGPEMREKHQVFYYLALTDFLDEYFWGRKGARTEPPDCSVFLGDEKLAKARGLLLAQGADIERPIFSLCPGSVNSEAKRWPEEDFARLADLLAETMNAQIVYLAADHERPLVERIQEATKRPGSANLAGRADMVTSMAIMNLSRMVISNDTGSAHLAVAASARVLTLFGPTSAGATAPYGPDAHVIEGSAACAPCRHFRCPLPDHPCMRSIGPEIVLKEVQEILHGGS